MQITTISPWLLSLSIMVGCGSSSKSGPVQGLGTTGQGCSTAEQCYPGLDASSLQGGAAVCMSQFANGYCTHHCAADTDCCAQPGECRSGYPEVCGPFESTGEMYCFLSCDAATLAAAGYSDETVYCQTFANAAFICRSTGGGSQNRKVCVPNG